MLILYPFRFFGQFADGLEMQVDGYSEQECIEELANYQDKHGELIWYGGACGEGYVDGEYMYTQEDNT